MRHIFSIISFACILFVSGNTFAQQQPQDQKTQVVQVQTPEPQTPTHLKFDVTTKDFGDLPQGIPATTVFTFTNTTSNPIALTNVQRSCGCTEPTYSKEPVLPGKTSTISATYNAAAPGNFNKSLTVSTSEFETYTLYIKGNVIVKQ